MRRTGAPFWKHTAAGRTAAKVIAICGMLACPGILTAAALEPGDYEFAVQHQGLARAYFVRVPPRASAGTAMPVVINFHGGGGNAITQKSYTRMDRAADREGFVAVYPNGTGLLPGRLLTWNAGACCGFAAARGIDDVGFVLKLIDDLAGRMPIDRGRIYATGLSNGSMMAYRVAAEAPERIAAVAGVAGAMTLVRFAPRLSVPVMHIHSVDDGRALYAGGLGPAFPMTDTRVFHAPVESMLKRWVVHNGCAPDAEVIARVMAAAKGPDAGHAATRYRYAPCADGVEVVLWKLQGPGHVWPGGERDFLPALLGTSSAVIDANAEIWRFLSRFRRSRP